jgi:hypothetical protein
MQATLGYPGISCSVCSDVFHTLNLWFSPQCVVSTPAAFADRSLLEMQNLGPSSDTLDHEVRKWGPVIYGITGPSDDSYTPLMLEQNCFRP